MSIHPLMTGDGSSSLYSDTYKEPYHSRHGAIAESMHVFLAMGLDALPESKASVSILEMGFGTGLNALLTCMHRGSRQIRYVSLEAEPVGEEQWHNLNYPELLQDTDAEAAFAAILAAPWEEETLILPGFTLLKHQVRLQDYEPREKFDLLYFDAFAPEAQPELWTEEIFLRLFSWMNPGGILVTYSAKGSVRRAMQAAGFQVNKVPGPPGKREMLRATKEIVLDSNMNI